MKRIPKVGDYVRLSTWAEYFRVLAVSANGDVLLDFKDTSYSYGPACQWVFRDPEKPVLDLSKPVQTRDGRAVRILCMDALGKHPVIGIIEGVPSVGRWALNGEYWLRNLNKSLVPIPPKPVTRTMELITWRGKDNGVSTQAMNIGWKCPKDGTVMARKTVTITEGEGL